MTDQTSETTPDGLDVAARMEAISDEAVNAAEEVWSEDEPTLAEYELAERILAAGTKALRASLAEYQRAAADMFNQLAAAESARDAAEGVVREVRTLAAKWSGCWCGTQQALDHDPRVRDCPQHGDDSCRHMAEGITVDLFAILDRLAPVTTDATEGEA